MSNYKQGALASLMSLNLNLSLKNYYIYSNYCCII